MSADHEDYYGSTLEVVAVGSSIGFVVDLNYVDHNTSAEPERHGYFRFPKLEATILAKDILERGVGLRRRTVRCCRSCGAFSPPDDRRLPGDLQPCGHRIATADILIAYLPGETE